MQTFTHMVWGMALDPTFPAAGAGTTPTSEALWDPAVFLWSHQW